MKIANSIFRYFVVLFLLCNYLLCYTPVCAQLTVGTNGLRVKQGGTLSVSGLVLQPTTDTDVPTLQRSSTPITDNGSSSISQVYALGEPIVFKGKLLFYYNSAILGGVAPNALRLAYTKTSGGPLTIIPGTVLNATNGVLECEFAQPITLQSITAMGINLTPPTLTITSDKDRIKAGETATITFTLSEASTNFNAQSIFVSNGTLGPLSGSGTSYTASFTPIANAMGLVIVAVSGSAFTNAVGISNTGATMMPIQFDTKVPSGYGVYIDQTEIGRDNKTAMSFTFSGAEVGTDFNYQISSSGGGTPITGNGKISAVGQQVSGIDVSSLGNGVLSLSATLTDGFGNTGIPATATVNKAVNNPAVVTTSSGATTFSTSFGQVATPVVIDNALTVTDDDNSTLASATVGITGNFYNDQDILEFTNDGSTMGNIAAGYSIVTGTLTLASAGATATLAEWQAALRAVKYSNSATAPNTARRTVSISVYDGMENSVPATKQVNVVLVNLAPVALDDAYTTDEDVPLIVAAPGVLYNDTDLEGDVLTASLVRTTANGTLVLNPDGSFTYTPNANFNGTDSFTYKVSDGVSDSNIATVTITVSAVNDAPVNTVPGSQTMDENATLVFSTANGNAISVEDIDAGMRPVQVMLSATKGILTLSTLANLSITSGSNASTYMTITGTLVDINTALNGLVFKPSANEIGGATVTIASNDLGNTGSGGAKTATDLIAVQINRVAARVVSVSSSKTNGTYGVGTEVDITVSFDKVVSVTGTPGLLLKTGAVDHSATYRSGSETNTLTFVYTVQAGDATAKLDYVSSIALSVPGASIRDVNGTDASLGLPSPGASGSLGANKSIVIDGILPTGTIVINNGVTFTNATEVMLLLTTSKTPAWMELSNNGISWSAKESFATAKTWTMTAGDGLKTVYVRYTDHVGNVSANYSSTIELDQTAPATPANLSAVSGDAKDELSWTANAEVDFDRYELFVQPAGGAKVPLPMGAAVRDGNTYRYVHTGLTNGVVYQYFLVAVDHLGNRSAEASVSAKPMKQQQVSFAALVDRVYGDAPVELTASASSGLMPRYVSSNVNVAEVFQDATDGNKWKIRIKKAGSTTITAYQDGNAMYLPATPAIRTLTVTKAMLTIRAENKTKVYGADMPGLTFVYEGLVNGDTQLTTPPIAGTTATAMSAVGGYPIVLTEAVDANYTIAALNGVLTITKAALPAFTFTDASFVYNGVSRSLAVTGLPNDVSVTYEGNGQTEAGVYTVTATIDGGNNYIGMTKNAQLTIAKAALPAFSFADAAFTYDGTSKALVATGLHAGATVSSYVNNDQTNAGTYTVTAKVAGGTNYLDGSQTAKLTIAKAKQAIRFNVPDVVSRDAGAVALDVSSSAGLPVSLSIDDPSVATVSGTSLNVLRLGTVQVTAHQDGDGNHEAAVPVSVTIRIQDKDSLLPVKLNNALSPNGDGINDFLLIEGIQDYPENKVTIFDKNGSVQAEIQGYNNRDRVFTGKDSRDGTYFYYLDVKDNGVWKREKGFFVIKR